MAVPGEDEYFHITKQGRLITVSVVPTSENKLQRIPVPAYLEPQEDGFYFVRAPRRTSTGRLWEFQQVNNDMLICHRVPTTPYRLVLRRVEWSEPPEWLAKLFAHSSEWMDRHEKSA